MSVPLPAEAAMASIRHWSKLADLAKFAADGHGFGDSDGGFGITYPTDLDEYDRDIEKVVIPNGYVQAYGFWGSDQGGYEVLVTVQEYHSVLAQALASAGMLHEAQLVKSLSGPDVG
jgi:hypothetical protein